MEGSVVEVSVPSELWPRRSDWEGRVVTVYKSPGDRVAPGEVVVEVEIEKAILAIESPVGGVVEEVLARPGDHVGPGSTLLRVRLGGEDQAQDQA
ncbi:MAG: biotin attachment protein [Desulfurococcales archaeon]|nr:biotin attachment protein [Desulfurococcales archaeon]